MAILQICVAVLLDSFVTTRSQRDEERAKQRIKEMISHGTIGNPLDPLLEGLTREYYDETDLSRRIKELFEVVRVRNTASEARF